MIRATMERLHDEEIRAIPVPPGPDRGAAGGFHPPPPGNSGCGSFILGAAFRRLVRRRTQ